MRNNYTSTIYSWTDKIHYVNIRDMMVVFWHRIFQVVGFRAGGEKPRRPAGEEEPLFPDATNFLETGIIGFGYGREARYGAEMRYPAFRRPWQATIRPGTQDKTGKFCGKYERRCAILSAADEMEVEVSRRATWV